MRNSLIDHRIRYKFRSIIKLLLHFFISLIQLIGALAILALQIMLIITQTCVYHIGVGFWSVPFLLLAPISIWLVIWQRTSIACSVAIATHLIATFFATSIIIISFLSLIGETGCSTSSLNIYYIPLNSSFIGVAGLFKIFNYCEIILLCQLKRNTDQIPTLFVKNLYETDSTLTWSTTPTNTWRSWSSISSETPHDSDYLFF